MQQRTKRSQNKRVLQKNSLFLFLSIYNRYVFEVLVICLLFFKSHCVFLVIFLVFCVKSLMESPL